MKFKKKPKRHRFGISMKPEHRLALEQLREERGHPLTFLLDEAIADLLQKYRIKAEPTGQAAPKPARAFVGRVGSSVKRE